MKRREKRKIKKEKVGFYFDPPAMAALEELKKKTGLSSNTEVIRHSLASFDWVIKELVQGGTIMLRRHNSIEAVEVRITLPRVNWSL